MQLKQAQRMNVEGVKDGEENGSARAVNKLFLDF